MPRVYDALDVYFSWNGDLDIGRDGDIKDTSDDYLKSILQDIHDVAASCLGDWELYPAKTAGLDDYIGESNNRNTADAIHDRLRMAIISLGIVAEEDLSIRIIPVHINKLLIVITVKAISTPFNSLGIEQQTLVTNLVFDFMEKGVSFFEKVPEL